VPVHRRSLGFDVLLQQPLRGLGQKRFLYLLPWSIRCPKPIVSYPAVSL
jgi:hypothetical protein